MKRITITILINIFVLIVVLGLVFHREITSISKTVFRSISISNHKKELDKKVRYTGDLEWFKERSNVSPERSSAYHVRDKNEPAQAHTIIIENVLNTKQLEEILRILESYTIENEIRDLKINCYKDKNMRHPSSTENPD